METTVAASRGARAERAEPSRDTCPARRTPRPAGDAAMPGNPDHPDRLLLGTSDAMRAVRAQLCDLAPAPWPVRLEGPTGSGKGAAARFLHLVSPRRDGPFVTQPLTALSDGLELPLLVGHRAGTFTGAFRDQTGAFEHAHRGTLFLDEIADAAPAAQGHLLHPLEDGAVKPLGEPRPRWVDVRVVVATNRSLDDAVRAGTFREDLYYRLGPFVVRLPALRDRREDIPLLGTALLPREAAHLGRVAPTLPARVLDALCAYPWPGNVRELLAALRYFAPLGWPGERVSAPEHERSTGERVPLSGVGGSVRDRDRGVGAESVHVQGPGGGSRDGAHLHAAPVL